MSSDEPQDVRLELASKVSGSPTGLFRLFCLLWSLCLTLGALLLPQIFLCKAKDVTGVDKAKLQSEVLEVVYKEGELRSAPHRRCCWHIGSKNSVNHMAGYHLPRG